MKKLLLILVIAFSLALASCGGAPSSIPAATTDADGNRMIKDEYSITIYPDDLPCSIPYNDEKITVKDFRLYQLELNYEYTLFAVAEIDLSELSDKSYHWIFEDKDLSYNAYLDGGANDFDFATMSQLGAATKYNDIKLLKVCWASSFFNKYKESFDGTEVVFTVYAEQEEGLPYHISFTPDTETISGPPAEGDADYDFLVKKLHEENPAWDYLSQGK